MAIFHSYASLPEGNHLFITGTAPPYSTTPNMASPYPKITPCFGPSVPRLRPIQISSFAKETLPTTI